jgi:tRNA pseudouridine-54 N-methylase
MEKLQNETAMYTRLVYIDTVGHDLTEMKCQCDIIFIIAALRHVTLR